MKSFYLRSVIGAAMLFPAAGATAASAQVAPATMVQPASLPSASAVAAFYKTYRSSPIWFRGGAASPAAGRLVSILKRAQFDGLASGPQLALQVETAIARAASRNPAEVMAAEQTLAAAWVLYVQALKRSTPGMMYAYPVLTPQGTRVDQILLTAAAAPSLESYLVATSNVNALYAQLREAGWKQAQVSGSATPDPRLLANLDRLRSIPASGRYVLVDAGSQRLWMYENGQPIDSMKVIVGMSQFRTPMVASIIHYAVFNPYWNVPDHLVRKTVGPNVLKQGFGYLKSRGYEVMTDWTRSAGKIPPEDIDWKAVVAGKQNIRVREMPGAGNSMGNLKIPFPNGEGIFLHDTPNKALFAKAQRTLSNGCIRLEDAKRLGRWLLGREPVAPSAEPEIQVPLPQGVPVYVTYLTAQPSSAGVTYLADVYGWDQPYGQQVASK